MKKHIYIEPIVILISPLIVLSYFVNIFIELRISILYYYIPT